MKPRFTPTGVVVVGGGMAGLSAASFLAREGVGVTLLEKAPILGGRAATRSFEGFSFNRGIHAIYTGGAASQVFKELDVTYGYGMPPKETFVLQKGALHPFPADPLGILRTGLLSAGDKAGLIRFVTALSLAKPHAVAHMSVQEWLKRHAQRPQVYRLMAAAARTLVYSSALELVSAQVFVERLQRSLKHPVHYVDGGWQTLVAALRDAAEQAGTRIVSGAHAQNVEHHEGLVRGVRLSDGTLIPASAVIIATKPQDALKLVEGGDHLPLRQVVDGLLPGQLACLDVALSSLPSSRYTVVQDLDHPQFMSVQSLYSHLAPEGGALIHTFKQLDPVHPTDPREDERELEALLDVAQPGWRDVLVRRQYLPRIEAVSTLPTAAQGGFAGRPGPEVPGFANLYMVGDWIGSEDFLVDASMASARQAAQILLRDGSLSRGKVAAGSRS